MEAVAEEARRYRHGTYQVQTLSSHLLPGRLLLATEATAALEPRLMETHQALVAVVQLLLAAPLPRLRQATLAVQVVLGFSTP